MRVAVRVAAALAFGAAIAVAAGLAGLAQPPSNQPSGETAPPNAAPPGVPIIQTPPEATPPSNSDESQDNGGSKAPATNSVKRAAVPPAPPPPPPAAPKPVRSPAAVIQALDKVTTETMRFAVPVGQPVRYKNLVFMVKACETTALGQASPQSSAYVVIDLAPPPAEGVRVAPPRQVYKGWMFANSPGLNPFQHPIYDAWLISCMAATPAPTPGPNPSPPPPA